jgi:hypothetical protein
MLSTTIRMTSAIPITSGNAADVATERAYAGCRVSLRVGSGANDDRAGPAGTSQDARGRPLPSWEHGFQIPLGRQMCTFRSSPTVTLGNGACDEPLTTGPYGEIGRTGRPDRLPRSHPIPARRLLTVERSRSCPQVGRPPPSSLPRTISPCRTQRTTPTPEPSLRLAIRRGPQPLRTSTRRSSCPPTVFRLPPRTTRTRCLGRWGSRRSHRP